MDQMSLKDIAALLNVEAYRIEYLLNLRTRTTMGRPVKRPLHRRFATRQSVRFDGPGGPGDRRQPRARRAATSRGPCWWSMGGRRPRCFEPI